jgi:DNA-binding NarL/FixJ family response regulator
MVSMHGDRQYIFEALRAGASGYLLKDSATTELTAAIHMVAAGGQYLSPKVAQVAVDDYVRRAHGRTEASLELLSNREREVLRLIADGLSSPRIAGILHISSHTVDTHRRKIMEKLGIRNLAGLVKFSIRHGLASIE